MNFQFTNPYYLLLLAPGLAFVIWFAWKSDVQISPWRRWAAFGLRIVIVIALVLAIAGLQWKKPLDGMNVFFLLDHSDSVPSSQQEAARDLAKRFSARKKLVDKAGALVFGADTGIESMPGAAFELEKIQTIVGTERTDISSAIRLGAMAFPEAGQKRLVLFSDGNENLGDAQSALLSVKDLGVTLDVVPLGVVRANDVSVQKLALPNKVKKGQVFEVKIFAQSDQEQTGTVRLFRNDQFLGEQKVELAAGKNLFAFPQTLDQPGFYSYDVQLEAPGDLLPQNNRASSFVHVRGNPSVLVVSSEPKPDETLLSVLQSSKLEVRSVGVQKFPSSLAELQSYDAVFLSNVSAGDLGTDSMSLLESAVHDFGVGLVCIGGDQAFGAGSYRGTPLETVLPVEMELSSKKVLPNGALALVIDKSGSMSGEKLERAKQAAIGAVAALNDLDYVTVIAFDGAPYVVVEMQRAKDRKAIMDRIAGIQSGGGTTMFPAMERASEELRKVTASFKHCIVLTDGHSTGGDFEKVTREMVENRITVSTIGVGMDFDGQLLQHIAHVGRGRFYDVASSAQLPQVFIKEVAVILKAAIFEEPFQPQLSTSSEMVRGIGATEYPQLGGYVCTTPKTRAEIPLVTDKGDPLLAHWQYGLGRTVAFTSDAKAKWAVNWIGWEKFQQFWSQVAQWSLRRIENADFNAEIGVDKGEGHITVEAIDAEGNYRNFLNLQTVVVSPKGEKQTIRLEQTGAGHYEAKFPTREVGAYLMNLMDLKDGELIGSQILGASVNYSPEFNASKANMNLLLRLAESGGGKILDPQTDNPFLHNRVKTFQPYDLWEWLLKFAIILFPLDVAVRRIQLDREELLRVKQWLRRWILFWKPAPLSVKTDESLAALLNRRDEVRARKIEANPVATVLPQTTLFESKTAAKIELENDRIEQREEKVETSEAKTEELQNTTRRLLEAKRRARKNLE